MKYTQTEFNSLKDAATTLSRNLELSEQLDKDAAEATFSGPMEGDTTTLTNDSGVLSELPTILFESDVLYEEITDPSKGDVLSSESEADSAYTEPPTFRGQDEEYVPEHSPKLAYAGSPPEDDYAPKRPPRPVHDYTPKRPPKLEYAGPPPVKERAPGRPPKHGHPALPPTQDNFDLEPSKLFGKAEREETVIQHFIVNQGYSVAVAPSSFPPEPPAFSSRGLAELRERKPEHYPPRHESQGPRKESRQIRSKPPTVHPRVPQADKQMSARGPQARITVSIEAENILSEPSTFITEIEPMQNDYDGNNGFMVQAVAPDNRRPEKPKGRAEIASGNERSPVKEYGDSAGPRWQRSKPDNFVENNFGFLNGMSESSGQSSENTYSRFQSRTVMFDPSNAPGRPSLSPVSRDSRDAPYSPRAINNAKLYDSLKLHKRSWDNKQRPRLGADPKLSPSPVKDVQGPPMADSNQSPARPSEVANDKELLGNDETIASSPSRKRPTEPKLETVITTGTTPVRGGISKNHASQAEKKNADALPESKKLPEPRKPAATNQDASVATENKLGDISRSSILEAEVKRTEALQESKKIPELKKPAKTNQDASVVPENKIGGIKKNHVTEAEKGKMDALPESKKFPEPKNLAKTNHDASAAPENEMGDINKSHVMEAEKRKADAILESKKLLEPKKSAKINQDASAAPETKTGDINKSHVMEAEKRKADALLESKKLPEPKKSAKTNQDASVVPETKTGDFNNSHVEAEKRKVDAQPESKKLLEPKKSAKTNQDASVAPENKTGELSNTHALEAEKRKADALPESKNLPEPKILDKTNQDASGPETQTKTQKHPEKEESVLDEPQPQPKPEPEPEAGDENEIMDVEEIAHQVALWAEIIKDLKTSTPPSEELGAERGKLQSPSPKPEKLKEALARESPVLDSGKRQPNEVEVLPEEPQLWWTGGIPDVSINATVSEEITAENDASNGAKTLKDAAISKVEASKPPKKVLESEVPANDSWLEDLVASPLKTHGSPQEQKPKVVEQPSSPSAKASKPSNTKEYLQKQGSEVKELPKHLPVVNTDNAKNRHSLDIPHTQLRTQKQETPVVSQTKRPATVLLPTDDARKAKLTRETQEKKPEETVNERETQALSQKQGTEAKQQPQILSASSLLSSTEYAEADSKVNERRGCEISPKSGGESTNDVQGNKVAQKFEERKVEAHPPKQETVVAEVHQVVTESDESATKIDDSTYEWPPETSASQAKTPSIRQKLLNSLRLRKNKSKDSEQHQKTHRVSSVSQNSEKKLPPVIETTAGNAELTSSTLESATESSAPRPASASTAETGSASGKKSKKTSMLRHAAGSVVHFAAAAVKPLHSVWSSITETEVTISIPVLVLEVNSEESQAISSEEMAKVTVPAVAAPAQPLAITEGASRKWSVQTDEVAVQTENAAVAIMQPLTRTMAVETDDALPDMFRTAPNYFYVPRYTKALEYDSVPTTRPNPEETMTIISLPASNAGERAQGYTRSVSQHYEVVEPSEADADERRTVISLPPSNAEEHTQENTGASDLESLAGQCDAAEPREISLEEFGPAPILSEEEPAPEETTCSEAGSSRRSSLRSEEEKPASDEYKSEMEKLESECVGEHSVLELVAKYEAERSAEKALQKLASPARSRPLNRQKRRPRPLLRTLPRKALQMPRIEEDQQEREKEGYKEPTPTMRLRNYCNSIHFSATFYLAMFNSSNFKAALDEAKLRSSHINANRSSSSRPGKPHSTPRHHNVKRLTTHSLSKKHLNVKRRKSLFEQ